MTKIKRKPFKHMRLAAKEGKVLHPEDLTSQELNQTILETSIPDMEFRAVVEKNIEQAIKVGVEIARMLDDVKPMARVMIAKNIYDHTMEVDKKMVQLLRNSGMWGSI